jgi:hypothetical protein
MPDNDFVIIRRYSNSHEADVVCAMLQAEGIDTSVLGAGAGEPLVGIGVATYRYS